MNQPTNIPQYPYTAPAARPNWWNRRSKGAKIAIGVTAGLFVIGVAAPAPQTTSTAAVKAPVGTPTMPIPSAIAAPVTTGFGPGTYLVGSDIAPGTYRAGVEDSMIPMCYWARLSDATGNGIIVNDVRSAGSSLVTIKPSDYAFETSGCTAWVKIS